MAQQTKITIEDLVEAGAHFGHQTRRWNPKMGIYIFGAKNGIHILDLAKTLKLLKRACETVRELVAKRKAILFVGTKKAAKAIIREEAERAGEFYVSERWLGGTLTNFLTIRQSIKKMERIEKRVAAGGEDLTKKEFSVMTQSLAKLEKNLSGIRGMRKLPGLIVVVDPMKEDIAVKEAKKLGIPVMAIADTNCDPDPVDYIIPCNDDSQRSVKLVLEALCNSIAEQKKELKMLQAKEADEEGESPDETASDELVASMEITEEKE